VAKKPDPAGAVEAASLLGLETNECCFIGDSDVDMMTAVNAGMLPVGVSWGFRSVEELRQAGAEVILETPADLPALVGIG
jgi:phosphoglycolate phosphatase